MVKVYEHPHPLKLVDLKVKDEDVEESDDEEEKDDLVTHYEFVCICKRCDQEINEYYRYYYKCIDDSCDYPLHKSCAELPSTLKHTSHRHLLTLGASPFLPKCSNCERRFKDDELRYECSNYCLYAIHVNCGMEVDKGTIHHPSHPHPLVSLISKPILCDCSACGKEHKGIFFLCNTCSNFTIHSDCAFLPKSLLIQHTTNDTSHHTHPLILSYSFPKEEQSAKYFPRCRVCDGSFSQYLWIYKCEKCIYYTHLDCAASKREPFMYIISHGIGQTIKNFEDADYPNLLQLPFPDQTYSIPKHLFSREIGPTTYEVSVEHLNHQHELILVNTEPIVPTSSKSSSLIMCHNPMKRIQLLCNGCLRPITEMPFYKCGANEDEGCNFALHEWCTRLPRKVENHPGHPYHALTLMPIVPGLLFNIFHCKVCLLPCNGYAYGCAKCEYYVDVSCAFIPKKITHKSHPDHLLSTVRLRINESKGCFMCRKDMLPSELGFGCSTCDVYIHPECALLLPETIRHSYDKHPMHLSYLPIENHKSEYFCEICEFALNPHSCFYHCQECVQSVHSACAPVILCCETETCSEAYKSIYKFINVKFGSIHKTDDHPHPLSFAQGIFSDGRCNLCGERLQYDMILKCLECQFSVHAFKSLCWRLPRIKPTFVRAIDTYIGQMRRHKIYKSGYANL